MDKHTKNFDANWALQNLEKGFSGVLEYVKKLEKQAEGVTGQFMSVKDCSSLNGLMQVYWYEDKENDINKGYNRFRNYGKRSLEETCDLARKHADQLFEQAKRTHEENKEALVNNLYVFNSVVAMMQGLGIRDTYSTYEYKTKRSRKKTEYTHTAGYIGDLRRKASFTDGFDLAEREYNNYLKKIETYRKEKLEKAAKEQQDKDAAEKEAKRIRDQQLHVLKYVVKYCPDNDSATIDDVLPVMFAQNQYLGLSHAMRCVRELGYEYKDNIFYCLNNFVESDETDEDIYKDVMGAFERYENDNDGRYFRDNEYNYNYLLTEDFVSLGLFNDYNSVLEILEIFE